MGLNDQEVIVSRKKYGSNTFTKIKRKSFLRLLLESFGDPIIKILLIVLLIKLLFLFKEEDLFETIGILVAILSSSLISTISEYGSESSFKSLEDSEDKVLTKVIRNNNTYEINYKEVVVGDTIILNSGDKIVADGKIIEGELKVNEANINGEVKEKKKIYNDIVYSGTSVYDGNGVMIVDAVGDNTIMGKLNREIQEESPISPLKIRLGHLAKIISIFGYIGALLVFIIYLIGTKDYSINNILYAMTLSITVIVVSVPEGLPMMITLVLSSNMKRMIKDNVLVRKLIGIETSGNINVLLTDKTGTLTEGKLNVVSIITYDNIINKIDINKNLDKEINNNLYYNNSALKGKDNNIIGGNSTDQAILKYSCSTNNYKVIDRLPFNSNNKYSLVTLDNNVTYIKGASEVLLDKCTYYLNSDANKKLLFDKKKILKEIDKYTKLGIRVVLLASSTNYYKTKELDNLTYMGLILIKDKIRTTSHMAINTLNNAGINTIMVTGDSLNTATLIAKETNIMSDDDIALDSKAFNELSDDELLKIYPKLKVVARSLPADKSRLVSVLEANDLIVGMCGDGVNDAPALKKANVGFGMGSGSDVAKEASDIIILDNNILSITKAILYGRTIFKSIRKFIVFQLTVNMCACIMAIIGPLINISSPVTIIQMLWINMIMDTLAGIAFSYEAPLKRYMMEEPKKSNTKIINKYMYEQILFTGLYSSLVGILFLKVPIFNMIIRQDNKYIMTAYFTLFIFIGIFNAFNARTERINLFANLFNNITFIIIFSIIIIIQIYLIYNGGDLFRTYGLNIKEFIYILLLSFSVIPFDLIRKKISKKRLKYSF